LCLPDGLDTTSFHATDIPHRNVSLINLTRLRHVVAVDRAGSFSVAASQLGITQSAITKSVAVLEEALGQLLFERRARGVVATEEGRDFIDRAGRIVADLDSLVVDAKQQGVREGNLLRIGVCPPAIEPFLSRPLSIFIGDRRRLALHLTALTSERALRFLKRGDFDVLVGPTELFSGDSNIVTHEVGELKAYLFARKDHPLAVQREVDVEQLKRYSLISPELYIGYSEVIAKIYRDGEEISQNMVSVVDHFPLVSSMVRCSDRIGVVGGGYQNSKQFRLYFDVLQCDVFRSLSLSCATMSNNIRKPQVEALIEQIAICWKTLISD
jgi:DNA-binding transcriptional LysR family regulator